MKLVTIDKTLYKKFKGDEELLHKAQRPCVLVIRLKYKGYRYDFAVPIRSNIAPGAPKNTYFPLPPRSKTRPHHRHGIHYIKMFPIERGYIRRYRTEGNAEATRIKKIIDENEKRIVQECQAYLNDYENGNIPLFATDIDYLISQLCK